MGVKHMSIQEALQYVADKPAIATDEIIELPVYELICRSLFELANSPNVNNKGSLRKANVARKILLNRMVGTRRTGSHPATRREISVEFVDLAGELN